jgi:aminopeptidase N
VHELAHQWFGDSLTLASWSNIWLNEGFAAYAEWLWQEDQGQATAQESFDAAVLALPADDPFWTVVIGDPGTDQLFDAAVYVRGAMTLHALRDDDFFEILECWASSQAGETVSIDEFIDVAEASSGAHLRGLFDAWLFQPSKPVADPLVEAAPEAIAGD